MVGLPDGEKTLRICITVWTQYRRVTDRQTDGQTDILPRYSPRYAYASRGKNLESAFSKIICLRIKRSCASRSLKRTCAVTATVKINI